MITKKGFPWEKGVFAISDNQDNHVEEPCEWCDKCYMTHSVGWTFSQNFSSLALPVWDWQCLEDIWTKGSLNELMNDGGSREEKGVLHS